jgi:hypothetical protein
MKKTDFQLIGYPGTILGILFLVSGGVTYYYQEVTNFLGISLVSYPYRQYTESLLVVGIVLLVFGLAFLWRAEQETTTQAYPSIIPPPTPAAAEKKYCRFCGSENKSDASYCSKCGKRLE